MSDFEWMRDAYCLGVIDPMWDESTPSVDALRMCFRCPVIRDCAKYGLSRPYASDAGVMGGMGLYDRQRVRSGKATVRQVWDFRLREVIAADWESAKDEQYARMMPQLALT
jgi:hypothetical protein